MSFPEEHRIFQLLETALDQPVGERRRFVEELCRGDRQLQEAVLALVAAAGNNRGFLEVARRSAPPRAVDSRSPSSEVSDGSDHDPFE